MAACARIPFASALPLIQIRHGYAAVCRNFRLTVEAGPDGWTADVRALGGEKLYQASRYSLSAAKAAVVEFAAFGASEFTGRTPEQLARELSWQEYW